MTIEPCALFIGCFQTCKEENSLLFDLAATETGTHTVEYYFLESVITFEIEGISGEAFEIPVTYFNEAGDAKIKIVNPDGTYYTAQVSDKIYSSFLISVKPSHAIV